MKKTLVCAALLLLVASASAEAQAPPAVGPPKPPPKLVFDREVFEYPGSSRRDPFRPLSDNDTQGPQFSEITLSGIFVMPNPAQSLVMFQDLSKKQYRLKRGESVGNITVLDITKSTVVFSVEEFGMKRREVLDLKTSRAGAN